MKTVNGNGSVLSQFMAIANLPTPKGKEMCVVLDKNAGTGHSLRLCDAKELPMSSATNLETRRMLYQALSDSGASKEFLKSAYKQLLGNKEHSLNAPLKSLDVRDILQEQFKEEYTVAESEDDNGFTVVSRNDGLFEDKTIQSEEGAERGTETRRKRDKLMTFIIDRAAHKGVTLTRRDLAPLDLKGLREVYDSGWEGWKLPESDLRKKIVDKSQESRQILKNETLDAIDRLDADEAFGESVTFDANFKKVEDRKDVKDLLADLVLDFNISENDCGSPTLRIAKTLLKYKTSPMRDCALSKLLNYSEASIKAMLSPAVYSTYKKVRPLLGELVGIDWATNTCKVGEQEKPLKNFIGMWQDGVVYQAIDALFAKLERKVQGDEVPDTKLEDALTKFNDGLESYVNEQSAKMQDLMTRMFGAALAGRHPNVRELINGLDPDLASIIPGSGSSEPSGEVVEPVDISKDFGLLRSLTQDDMVRFRKEKAALLKKEKADCETKKVDAETIRKDYADIRTKVSLRENELRRASKKNQQPDDVWTEATSTEYLGEELRSLQDKQNELIQCIALAMCEKKDENNEELVEGKKSEYKVLCKQLKELGDQLLQAVNNNEPQNSMRDLNDRYLRLEEEISNLEQAGIERLITKKEKEYKDKLDKFDKEIQRLEEGGGDVDNPVVTVGTGDKVSEFSIVGVEKSRKLNPDELKTLSPAAREAYDLRILKTEKLSNLASRGFDPTRGYGKFLMDVFNSYFKNSDVLDKRAMLASLIRNAPTLKDGDYASLLGGALGSYFKGAGPLMQKQLQQISSMPGLPDAFKTALADMRSNLTPLPDKVVHALLANVVAQSNGAIVNLKVIKTLGAASVAQSVLCSMTTSKGEKRDVVVKLIRPDAENRVAREEKVFLEAAKASHMELTFLGRLKTIREEFELGIEQENAKSGAIYNKTGTLKRYGKNKKLPTEKFNDVHAVKIDPLSPPNGQAMIMAVAPGTTIDRLIADANRQMEALKQDDDSLHDLFNLNGPRARIYPLSEEQKNCLKANPPEKRIAQFTTVMRKQRKLRDQLVQSHRQMAHFMRTWLGQALFGTGFYHGDVHAGNVMVDLETDPKKNQGLTVIDFGNATQVSSSDSTNIKKCMLSFFTLNVADFLESYRAMLSPAGTEHFDREKASIQNHLALIFDKARTDTRRSSVGDVVVVALDELQRMGVEMPSALFNFVQCFTMMMGTMIQQTDVLATLGRKMTGTANYLLALMCERHKDMADKYLADEDVFLSDDLKMAIKNREVTGYLEDEGNLKKARAAIARYVQYNEEIKEAFDGQLEWDYETWDKDTVRNVLQKIVEAREAVFKEAQELYMAGDDIPEYSSSEILRGVITENILATGFAIGPSGIVKAIKAM